MHYTWTTMEAERAFSQASAARRRARLGLRLRRRPAACSELPVHEGLPTGMRTKHALRGIQSIPLTAIEGTLEPSRARDFDREFRPAPRTRDRWLRVWIAGHLGVRLPPIAVVSIGEKYVIRDGHHRVSVARARGAVAIDAVVVG
jgi:hypothetical protein